MSATEALPATRRLLESYSREALRAMALRHGLDVRTLDKARLVELLLDRLGAVDPETMAAIVAALDPAPQAALRLLQRAGGKAGRDVLEAMLARQGLVPAAATERAAWSGSSSRPRSGGRAAVTRFEGIMAELELAGLVLGLKGARFAGVLQPGSAAGYVVPAEVWPNLPPAPAPAVASSAISRTLPGDSAAFSRELHALFGFVWRRRPSLTRHHRLPKKTLRALLQEMRYEFDPDLVGGEEDMPRHWFGRSLLLDRGLIRSLPAGASAGELEADLEAAWAWWSKPLAQRMRDCLESWLAASWWVELTRLPDVLWRPAFSDDLLVASETLKPARAATLVSLVRAAAGDGWTDVATAMDDLFLAQRDFLVPPARGGSGRRSRYVSYENAQGWSFAARRGGAVGWESVEGGFLAVVLTCLRWLGLVDLGLGSQDTVVAYRLTEMGRHLLAGAPVPAEVQADGGRVVLQPNFRILVIGPVPEIVLLELERFADRLSTDVAIEFELNRQSVYRGQLSGLDAAGILPRLAELTGAEVPQNVARSLAEWQTLHERVVVHVGTGLVQTADGQVLDDILSALEEAGAGRAAVRLSPTFARLPADTRAAGALDACLGALGRSTRRVEAMPAGNSVTLGSDGEVRSRQHCPTMVVLGALQRLAEMDEATGQYRLSRAAVQHASRVWGLDADAQFKQWATVLSPPVPDWLAQRLKTWSGHYGSARISRPILLTFADERTLAELREVPGLAQGLGALPSPGATAVVAAEDLEAVRAALADLGVELVERPEASEPAGPAAGPKGARRTRRGSSPGRSAPGG